MCNSRKQRITAEWTLVCVFAFKFYRCGTKSLSNGCTVVCVCVLARFVCGFLLLITQKCHRSVLLGLFYLYFTQMMIAATAISFHFLSSLTVLLCVELRCAYIWRAHFYFVYSRCKCVIIILHNAFRCFHYFPWHASSVHCGKLCLMWDWIPDGCISSIIVIIKQVEKIWRKTNIVLHLWP